MAARLFRPHGHGGAAGQLFFTYNCKFIFQYSTIADKTACDQSHFLVNYLVNSLGFSRGEAISTSSKDKLRAALDFYMVQFGLKPAYLASHPTLLMFSMKKRVLPRLEFMRSVVEKKLYDEDYNLYTILLPSEQKFYQVYVLALKDKMPDVCELYNKIQQHGKDKK